MITTLTEALKAIDQLKEDLVTRDHALESACTAMEKLTADLEPMVVLADHFEEALNAMKLDAERYRATRMKEFQITRLSGTALDTKVDEFIETQSGDL